MKLASCFYSFRQDQMCGTQDVLETSSHAAKLHKEFLFQRTSKRNEERVGTRCPDVPRCPQTCPSRHVNSCQPVSTRVPTSPDVEIRDHLSSSEIVPRLQRCLSKSWQHHGVLATAPRHFNDLGAWRNMAKHGETWRNRFQVIVELMYDHVIFSLFQDERLNSACQIHPFGHKSQVRRSAAFCNTWYILV